MITALLFSLCLGGVARAQDNPPPPRSASGIARCTPWAGERAGSARRGDGLAVPTKTGRSLSEGYARQAPTSGRPPPQQQDHPHPKKKEPHWESEPFLRPEGGAQLNSSGGTPTAFVTLGAQAGFRYWRVGDPPPRWQGQTRVRGAYGTGSGVQSIDARIGSFIGPTWGAFGVQFGPDLFWNELLNPGPADLDPSVGVEFPVIASYAVSKSLHVYGGISPAWLANPERSVDWSEVALPGFGDEFAYLAGVSVSFGSVHVGLNYSYRIVATGGQQNIGLGFNLSG